MLSPETKDLFAALCKAQAEFPPIPKSGYNPHFKSAYSALDDYERCCRPVVAKYGIGWSQVLVQEEDILKLVTILFHTSGQWIQSSIKINPQKQDPQSMGVCISYMRRYALSSILGVSGSEDDDGNSNTFRNDGIVINDDQKTDLQSLIKATPDPKKCYQNILSYNKIVDLGDLPESSYHSVKSYIKNFKIAS